MQNSQLNKVLKLMRHTGDRVIIMDNESDSVLVLMDIDAYEKMLGVPDALESLSEEQMMEKINRDIAKWRSYKKDDAETDLEAGEEPGVTFSRIEETDIRPVENNFEPIDLTGGAENDSDTMPIPLIDELNFGQDNGKIELEEPLDGVPEEEEDKFYLEPVE